MKIVKGALMDNIEQKLGHDVHVEVFSKPKSEDLLAFPVANLINTKKYVAIKDCGKTTILSYDKLKSKKNSPTKCLLY